MWRRGDLLTVAPTPGSDTIPQQTCDGSRLLGHETCKSKSDAAGKPLAPGLRDLDLYGVTFDGHSLPAWLCEAHAKLIASYANTTVYAMSPEEVAALRPKEEPTPEAANV